MGKRADSVLFACGNNAIRSPMAAAILRHLHGRRMHVDSCGLRAGELDLFAVAVMQEIGLDIEAHRPKSFADLEDTNIDLVISLSPEAQHGAVELTRTLAVELELWPTVDPTAVWGTREQRLGAYRDVRDFLWRRVIERFPPDPA